MDEPHAKTMTDEHIATASNRSDADASTRELVERLRRENSELRRELGSLRVRSSTRLGARVRTSVTVLLIALTSISLVGAVVGLWFSRTIWDTDRYVSLVAPIADDPAVTSAISERVTSDVFEALDLRGRVEEALEAIPRLPPSAAFLAGPITAGAEDIVRRQVEAFVSSDAFRTLWIELNRALHGKVIALLEGDYSTLPSVSITEGEVQLNLISVSARVLREIVDAGIEGLGLNLTVPEIPADLDASAAIDRLSTAVGVTLPEDFGQLTIMTEEELTGYQQTAATLKRVGWVLALVTAILGGLTLLVARDRRRTVMWLAAVGIAALFIGGVFIRRIGDGIAEAIDSTGARAAARDVFSEIGSSLRGTGLLVGAALLGVMALAYIAGRPQWVASLATRVRQPASAPNGRASLDGWVSRHADALRIATGLVALVILFITGIDWLPVIIVGALVSVIMWQIAAAGRRAFVADPIVVVPDASEEPDARPQQPPAKELLGDA